MNIFKNFLAPAVFLTSVVAFAQEGTSLESDWLELVKGHKGETMGVELMEIEAGEEEGTQKVTLAVPKTAIEHPDAIEEVVVIGRAPEKSEPIKIKYEWVSDYDEDNYGLVIHLGEGNWPIRLFMNSKPGYVR